MNKETTLILAKGINLDRNYTNIINYSKEQMLSLCRRSQNFVAEIDKFTFIQTEDGENYIQCNIPYAQAEIANYIMFRNTHYSGIWYCAFIRKIQFIAPYCVRIYYDIDYFSTWFPAATVKECYVLREHVNNDSIGANLVEENIGIGDVTALEVIKEQSLVDSYVVIATTYDASTDKNFAGITIHNGSFFGYKLVVFPNKVSNWEDIYKYLLFVTSKGRSGEIHNMFIVPAFVINVADLVQKEYSDTINSELLSGIYWEIGQYTDEPKKALYNIPKKYSWSDYMPKNNKLYTYPYNYLMVTNNNGNTNILRYEDFSDDTANFELAMAISAGCSGIFTPLNYKGGSNIDESIPVGKYPICGWSSDSYITWLQQQAINIPSQIVNIAETAGSSLLANNISRALATSANVQAQGISNQMRNINTGVGLVGQVTSLMGSFYQAQLMPNIVKGGNTSDVLFSMGENTIYIKKMRCKLQFLRLIDDYFSRFGYQVNEVKLPNIIGRKTFNFVQIGEGENIVNGNIPSEAVNIINSIFQRGTTIWHNHDSIGNFNVDNSIIQ